MDSTRLGQPLTRSSSNYSPIDYPVNTIIIIHDNILFPIPFVDDGLHLSDQPLGKNDHDSLLPSAELTR